MKRFKKILLVFPCDDTTFEEAVSLARENQAELTVVRAARKVRQDESIELVPEQTINIHDLLIKEYQAQLDDVAARVKHDDIHLTTKILVGTPFIEIIREVISQEHDLIMMTSEGKGGLKERLFGSMSLHLMRKSPCPVWVRKPSVKKTRRRILAAVDPDPMDTTRNALNAVVLQLASTVAERSSAELHIAHAWIAFGEALLLSRGAASSAEIEKYAQDEQAKQRERLDALITKHSCHDATIHMVKGDAGSVVVSLARSEKIDLLVMGTVCRTGIPGFIIGNTAEKILDEVDCSVLTVKPEGFISPVQLP